MRLQGGRHLVVWHKLRIELEATRTEAGAPDSVRLVHRSRSPQVPRTHVLALRTVDGRTLTATTSRSDLQVQTTDLWLTFVVSRVKPAALLDAERGTLEVGGVRTRLQATHFAAMQDCARVPGPGRRVRGDAPGTCALLVTVGRAPSRRALRVVVLSPPCNPTGCSTIY